MDFVSPENIGECFHLTEAFLTLPENHRAKAVKLEELGSLVSLKWHWLNHTLNKWIYQS
ncbi:hypothetical protein RchiOBHm_Chr2g0164361 [Rosa chinensis]|uniref:Uncharacterized protein n=1 Tax=Rosa chinensis TaxID=74649 RepID=A0A2P6S3J9_ROSCH|nr:hypothetical protein RchiOBHm_Chr2g0164361 [Rosa chinensis]